MSNRTDPPDWLDELYQQNNAAEPPPALDNLIRAAARQSAQPWYRQAGKLAAAASVMLAAGIVTLWLNEPELRQQMPVVVSSSDATVLTDDEGASAPAAERVPASARPAQVRDNRRQLNEQTEAAPRQEELLSDLTPDRSDLQQMAKASREVAGLAVVANPCDKFSEIMQQGEQLYSICEQTSKITVMSPDCAAPYVSQGKRYVSSEADGALLLVEDGSSWRLSCSDGEWVLTQVSEQ